MLRAALESLQSPWSSVVAGLILTLDPLDEKAKAAFRKLILQGPPAEMVGVQSQPFFLAPKQEAR